MKKSTIWQLAIMAILFAAPAYAEPSALSLDQVIKESLQKNTSLFRAQRDYDDKMATATETTLLDNPELQVDVLRDDAAHDACRFERREREVPRVGARFRAVATDEPTDVVLREGGAHGRHSHSSSLPA